MKVTVIVPAYNEEKLIASTLREIGKAMTAFSRAGWEMELIVCDNNSTDRTAELARAAGARVVFEPVNQIGRARNRGAAAGTGDWLLFIDADSHPALELLRQVIEQIESGDCLAGGATVRLDENYLIPNCFLGVWNWLSRSFHWMAGSFIFCEAAAFREIGGFSTELFASEEVDLSRRLKRLARRKQKRIAILDRNPVLTSARKCHLYSPAEYIWFLVRTFLTFGATLKRRESCGPWYDGRR